MPRLMLIDGNSLTYRAFFALPTDMATASGQVTNAVYGFTSMLINLLRDHRPDHVAVAFDRPEPTFRHEAVEDYKANREESPDILRQQMGLVRELVGTLAIPVVEVAGYEADDVIATLATRARDAGMEVIVVTGDRDCFQLVEDPSVKVLYNKRGVSDYVMYDERGIEERTGVPPGLYVPYAALRGDTSDNLPGVPGVGEKTAARLITAHGGIDGVYGHLDEQSPKLRANLAEAEERVRRNVEVMALVRDAPVPVGPDELAIGRPDPEAVRQLFDFLELRTLRDRLPEAFGDALAAGDAGSGSEGPRALHAALRRAATAAEVVEEAGELRGGQGWLVVSVRAQEPAGIAVVLDTGASQVAWWPAALLEAGDAHRAVDELLGTGSRPLAAHDAKRAMVWLARNFGIEVRSLALDTAIAAYLLDPGEGRYELSELLARYGAAVVADDRTTPDGQLDLGSAPADPEQEAADRALAVAALADPLLEAVDAQHLRRLNDEVEVPLVRVLAQMEVVGVGVDVDELRAIRDRLTEQCERLRRQVIEDAGVEFNVNSTRQLGEVLYDRLGLAPHRRTKTGYSTDAASLERLRGAHPIIDHLLEYREVEKLRSTYGEGLLAAVDPDGRIRATFNQTVARTGRLSSDAPNLHNIPVRTETGRLFRRAFVPAPGMELLVADYNQIELRCIAHLADDPGLVAAFRAGEDIHTTTAARIFHVDPGEVTLEMRSRAKMVSYGLAYGMEAYGLGQRLGIPTEEAAAILDAYFTAFPAVRSYMERTVEQARARGYTETLFGRRRRIPELSSSNHRVRQAGERQAMNAGIQGLAADIFKVALVRLDGALEDRGMASRIVLQVHDEIILEVAPDERDDARDLTVATMRDAFDLRVPLEVNVAIGPNWADAKP